MNAVCELNDTQFASGSFDNTLTLWNIDEEDAVRTYSGYKESVNAVCALNSMRFVSGSDDRTLKLWNVDSSTAVMTYKGHTGSVYAVCALNDTHFVSGSGDLKMWNVYSPTAILSIPTHSVYALDKLDGYHFVSGGNDNTLKLWRFFQPEELPSQELVDVNPRSNLYGFKGLPFSIVNRFIGNKKGYEDNKKIGKGGKRRNKKSKS